MVHKNILVLFAALLLLATPTLLSVAVPPTNVKLIPLDIKERSGVDLVNYTVSIHLRNCDSYEAIDEDGNVLPTFCDAGTLWIRIPLIPADGHVKVYLRKGTPGKAEDVFIYYNQFNSTPDYRIVGNEFTFYKGKFYWRLFVVGNEDYPLSREDCVKANKVFATNGVLRVLKSDCFSTQVLFNVFKVPENEGIRVEIRGNVSSKYLYKYITVSMIGLRNPATLENVTSEDIATRIGFYHEDDSGSFYFGMFKLHLNGLTPYNNSIDLRKEKKTMIDFRKTHVYGLGYFDGRAYGFVDGKKVMSAEVGKLGDYIGASVKFGHVFTDMEYEKIGYIRRQLIGSVDWMIVRKYVYPEPQVKMGEPITPRTTTPKQTQTTTIQTMTEETQTTYTQPKTTTPTQTTKTRTTYTYTKKTTTKQTTSQPQTTTAQPPPTTSSVIVTVTKAVTRTVAPEGPGIEIVVIPVVAVLGVITFLILRRRGYFG